MSEVSIVMPVFNGGIFLKEAIESVLAQTCEDWELILSDDGSTDGSGLIIQHFDEADPRITALFSSTNTGPGAARNRGMRIARGRWLAFLDCDDLWLPEKLEKTLAFARATSSAFTYTAYRRILAPDWRWGRDIHVPPSITYDEMLKGSVINSSTVLIDRSVLSSFTWNEEERPEDYIAWLGILRKGVVGRGLSLPLSIYRIGHRSRSSNKVRSALEVFRVYRTVEKLSVWRSVWVFLHYALMGLRKHVLR